MTLFKHIRTGDVYEYICEADFKQHGKWEDTIIVYKSTTTGRMYSRLVEDFDKHFIEVTDRI